MSGREWNGFLPVGVTCDRCGKVLDGEGGDNPAESYAGTYTGLCRTCGMAGPYVVKTDFDGAVHWSYPPGCPSWRRDREDYKGYPDCPDCKGSGCHWVSRSWELGGSYRSYCDRCLRRFYDHPIRVADRAFVDEVFRQMDEDVELAIASEVRRTRNGWGWAEAGARLKPPSEMAVSENGARADPGSDAGRRSRG